MAGYPQYQQPQQLNQQPGPYSGYPGQGQGQPRPGFAPQQQQQPHHPQQQQQQQRPPGTGHPQVRPGGPGPNGNPAMRPGNTGPHPGGGPARPPMAQPRPPHQQQYGPRPGPGNPAQVRPSSAPLGGMVTAPPAHSPAQQPRPDQVRPPPQQGYPKQAQLHQQQHLYDQQDPPPSQQDNYTTPGLKGLSNQMSDLSVGSSTAMDQATSGLYSTMPPQDLSSLQSEIKPAAKTGARAKRVFAVDQAAPPSHGQLSGMPPMPVQGSPAVAQYENVPPPVNQAYQPYPQQQEQPYQQPYQQQPYQQQPYQPQHQQQQQQQHHQHQHQPLPPSSSQNWSQSQNVSTSVQTQGQGGHGRPRIDPDFIPSPVTAQEADQELWNQQPYVTCTKGGAVPMACTDFQAIDAGNCNPRFLRMTTYQIPTSEELMEASCIPMGLVIQPLAELRADEAPIDIVDFGEAGPKRCRRCKAYINPYMRFTGGGQRFVCNLCLFENDVEPSYFCNLDMNGRRLDLDQRPELRNGSIEFAVPKEYSSKPPLPAGYVFAIDVSWTAVQSGMLNEAVKAVKQAIWDENGVSRLAPGVQIGVMTYDKTVHFYNLSPSLDQAQMLVVPDVGDMFVPLSEGFLVNPETSQTIVESMLDMLPHLFAENKTTDPVIGAAVQAVRMALEHRGGKLILFQTALPTFGPGALRQRDEARLYGTEKERVLYTSQDPFYQKLAESCVQVGLSIDLFLFPNAYIDIATVGTLASVTGGETFLYPNFSVGKDSDRFVGTLARLVSRPFGFNALLRVRCSTGLTTAEHVGNFFMKNGTDVELAGLDSERALGVLIKHEGGKLDDKTEASFQVALLYTTASGQRRVRVHNFSTPITGQMSQLFRAADIDTTMNFMARAVALHALSKPMKEVRDVLTDRCVRILSAYRRHCASSTAPGQLILPESYKLFPLYSLTMLKSKTIRAGRDINSDLRIQQLRMVQSMGVGESIAFFYPRLFDIGNLAGHVGVVDHHHPALKVALPGLVRTSYSRLDPAGAYILENGQRMFLWVGREVAQETLQDLFGISTLEEIDTATM
ncbi:COPII coat Sec23p-Sfb3p heterodimer component, partial [Podila verticillata]